MPCEALCEGRAGPPHLWEGSASAAPGEAFASQCMKSLTLGFLILGV